MAAEDGRLRDYLNQHAAILYAAQCQILFKEDRAIIHPTCPSADKIGANSIIFNYHDLRQSKVVDIYETKKSQENVVNLHVRCFSKLGLPAPGEPTWEPYLVYIIDKDRFDLESQVHYPRRGLPARARTRADDEIEMRERRAPELREREERSSLIA